MVLLGAMTNVPEGAGGVCKRLTGVHRSGQVKIGRRSSKDGEFSHVDYLTGERTRTSTGISLSLR